VMNLANYYVNCGILLIWDMEMVTCEWGDLQP
jgi:hypothetical protein